MNLNNEFSPSSEARSKDYLVNYKVNEYFIQVNY